MWQPVGRAFPSPGRVTFQQLTDDAVRIGQKNGSNVYGPLLVLLADCHPVIDAVPDVAFFWRSVAAEEKLGASYAAVEEIGVMVGMRGEELEEWLLLAESIPLADRHTMHILAKLQEQRGPA